MAYDDRGNRAALRLVRGGAPEPEPTRWFCGHCASAPSTGAIPLPHARVCGTCGLGLLLEAPESAAPQTGEPFVVVDGALSVRAMSRAAEELLGVCETDAVHRPLTELLVPADAEAQGPAGLAVAISWAAGGEEHEPWRGHIRPANIFGVRFRARIAPCGPPRAALVVLEG